ncbi:5' exonuclease [Actinidia chinensis var. chinensis]|uniref:Protein artemis n=1 Tax=Actinidia chinensis var. chinensis TaxID=1590841 RepID=A0A2R6QTK4_ACTCC|nr:5' exonuclease [Actinidia chinensis var. chinensis]
MEKGMISVDRWSEGSQVYFLTHLHADHTNGLSSTWKRGPLFCSRITAKLFPFKFPGFKLSLLRVLEIGQWHSISLVSPTTGSDTTVNVMAIDAHHCPGAVMYLFRGEFGCMLYTGDFRWEPTNTRAQIGRSMLHNAIGNDKVDILYLDNTYCNPSYSFPSREVAAKQVVDVIASHPDHDIVIGIDSLGKEDLLLHIARVLKMKIWVWPERLQIMHLLGFHDIFTTKISQTRVRAVPRYSFSIDTLEGLNIMRPTIGIMPSGLPWVVRPLAGNNNIFGLSPSSFHHRSKLSAKAQRFACIQNLNEDSRAVEKYHEYIYTVPYSDHSCFEEIKEFVKLVQPTNMKGIVASSFSYVDPLYYFGHLLRVNLQSKRLSKNFERKGGESVEAVHTKSTLENDRSAEARMKRKTREGDLLGVHVSRVSILRRIRCGAKILELD